MKMCYYLNALLPTTYYCFVYIFHFISFLYFYVQYACILYFSSHWMLYVVVNYCCLNSIIIISSMV